MKADIQTIVDSQYSDPCLAGLPVGLLLIIVQRCEWSDPIVDLLVIVEAVAKGPARLHLPLRPCIVEVLGKFLHQRVELVGELHA